MSWDVYHRPRAFFSWDHVDTIEGAAHGEEAILEAMRKARGSIDGVWRAYDNVGASEIEVKT